LWPAVLSIAMTAATRAAHAATTAMTLALGRFAASMR
jgi:hypothetical protein